MAYTDPLPLRHSWPLFERERYFALGQIEGGARLDTVADIVDAIAAGQPLHPRIGQWECRLSDNRLSWSGEVYDIFGIARGAEVARGDAVALYAENSRAAMERLRAHAIRHRRGFTIDVEIRPDRAEPRWMRLIAAPVCSGDAVVGLRGLKFIVGNTAE
ncbi:hypothetical protein [Sphingopyxis sp. P8]|uniref:hypothetical protein n=1 Tax=Sphingopyxis sp. P8 TaxID=2763256 RepID=UPI001D0BBA1B|nr:hypothetical protein [Sphingopyxis sp. P8]